MFGNGGSAEWVLGSGDVFTTWVFRWNRDAVPWQVLSLFLKYYVPLRKEPGRMAEGGRS